MYTVIVADDEKWIRTALVKRIESLPFDIKVVGDACDGKKALSLTQKLMPDILITDIKMPYFNGIELIKKVKEFHPSIKTIIVSGFADFKYAQKAIDLNVTRYILKPLKNNALAEVFASIISQLDSSIKAISEIENLKAVLKQRTEILRKSFMEDVIYGHSEIEGEINTMLSFLDLPFLGCSSFACVIFSLRISLNAINIPNIIRQINEHLKTVSCNSFCLYNSNAEDEIILLLGNKDTNITKSFVKEIITGILQCCFHNIRVRVGVSKIFTNFCQCSKNYRDANDAFKNTSSLKTDSNIVFFEEIEKSEDIIHSLTGYEKNLLAYHMESGNSEETNRFIEDYFTQLEGNGILNSKSVFYICTDIVLLLDSIASKNGKKLENIVQEDVFYVITNSKNMNVNKIKETLLDMSAQLSGAISHNVKNNRQTTLKVIKDYIDSSYFENITLNSTAKKFYISKGYLSQQFKKEFGYTFTDYITELRMLHSMKLLKESDLKVSDIAKMVGFVDPLYFSKVFKKQFGFSPSSLASKEVYT